MGITFPVEVETLVAKLLEKDPEKRYSNAQLLTHDLVQLEQALSESRESEPALTFNRSPCKIAKTTAKFRTADFVLIGLTIIAYFLGMGTSMLTRHPKPPPPTPAQNQRWQLFQTVR